METKRMLLIQVDESLNLMLAVNEPLGTLTPGTAAKVAEWSNTWRNDPGAIRRWYPSSIKSLGKISVEVDTGTDELLADIERYLAMDCRDQARLAMISGALIGYRRSRP